MQAGSDGVGSIVRYALQRAGVRAPAPRSHQFRHARWPFRYFEAAPRWREIGELLRHRSPQSTSIYAGSISTRCAAWHCLGREVCNEFRCARPCTVPEPAPQPGTRCWTRRGSCRASSPSWRNARPPTSRHGWRWSGRSRTARNRQSGRVACASSAASPATAAPQTPSQRCRPWLMPYRSTRAKPYIYTDDELRRLLDAARALPTRWPSTPAATMGVPLSVRAACRHRLRISEALDLALEDVDLERKC